MPRLEFECQLSVPVDGYGTHKLNDSLLLPGAFAYWAGAGFRFVATAGADKSQNPLKIRAF